MTLQKLIAFDASDLAVLSAHLQDAEVTATNMAFLPQERRFAFVGTRFARDGNGAAQKRPVGVHFEQVRHVRAFAVSPGSDQLHHLLALHFHEKDSPGGEVRLLFAGGGEISLDVDCLEALLSDLDTGEPCACPDHAV